MTTSVQSFPVLVASVFLAASSAVGQQPGLDAAVERVLSERGSARVVVMMRPPRLDESRFAYGEPARFLGDFLGERGRLVEQIGDLPLAVVETDGTGIADLLDRPEVGYVAADEPMPPLLHTSLGALRVDEVHQDGVLGSGHAVVVLDTGVDYRHSFFQNGVEPKLRAEACFSTSESEVYAVSSLCANGLDVDLMPGAGRNCNLPSCDHGTHVAGIAVGNRVRTPDGGEISGVAPDAGLISIQVFTEFHDAKVCKESAVPCVKSFPSDQLRALVYVDDLLSTSPDLNVASVNMSVGAGRFVAACDSSSILTEQIGALRNSGIPTVIGSGNDGYFNAVNAPGCISDAITVGGSLKDEAALDLDYSNTSSLVDFLAPGTEVVSAMDGGYGPKTGTSMAAPHIAGLFALLRSEAPSASVDDLEDVLKTTARRVTDPRTGLVLFFPDARSALDGVRVDDPDRQLPPRFGAWSPEPSGASSWVPLVGARRILIRPAVRGDVLAQIERLLGDGAAVRMLDQRTYLAERPRGFDVVDLSRLMSELGVDTRLYADDPVAPDVVR